MTRGTAPIEESSLEQQLQLDWSTADVRDGTLTVGLSETPPKKWRQAFERTAMLLGARTWDVTLNSKQASVSVASASSRKSRETTSISGSCVRVRQRETASIRQLV